MRRNRKCEKIQWSSLVFTIEVFSLAVKSIFAVLLTFGFKLHCRKNRKENVSFKTSP